MDFAITPEQEEFGREFREYLNVHLTPEIREESSKFMKMSRKTDPGVFGRGEYGGPKSKEFILRLGADGWLGVGWPKEFVDMSRQHMQNA